MVGLYGVPVADFVYYVALCIISIIVASKYTGRIKVGHAVSISLRALIAGLLGAVAALMVMNLLPDLGNGMVAGLVQLCVCGVVGLIVGFGLCIVFRIPEMNMVTRIIKRFLPKK